MDSNQIVYERENIYSGYFRRSWLFPAEKKFLQNYHKELPSFRMLDVGIGGGRTTHFFAPKVLHYTGIDYSGAMVQHCKQKFSSLSNSTFKEMDARDLHEFGDATFDLVFFSFNGIDCVDYEGRNRILSEFKRVLKPAGILLFSFHNARHLNRLYSFQMPRNPFKIPWEMKRRKKLFELNGAPAKYAGKEIFSLYDGADEFQTLIFYLTPELQIKDLKREGFETRQWLDLQSGRIFSEAELPGLTIPWIFIESKKA